jgi:hypothetical protein
MSIGVMDTMALCCGYATMMVATILIVTFGSILIVKAWNEYLCEFVRSAKNTYWFLVFRRVQSRLKLKGR